MDCHGLSWTVMDFHGLSWTVMDCHGLTFLDLVCLLDLFDIVDLVDLVNLVRYSLILTTWVLTYLRTNGHWYLLSRYRD